MPQARDLQGSARSRAAAAPREQTASANGDAAYAVLSVVRPLYQASARAVDVWLRGTGLTAGSRAVLELLLEQGPMTVPTIAREFGITRQSVQALVDATAARGLVTMADNPQHRRSHLVAVTDVGRRTFGETHRRELANLDRVTADLDPADLAVCARVLADLTDRVRRLHDHEQELP
jgi:DNA-binding MarR family transcriptional regulator